jgi:hypothetical protein
MDIINWLETAVDDVGSGKLVKERFNIFGRQWNNRYRSDCSIEAALAFLKAWQYSGDKKYLSLARGLYAGILEIQHENGAFPYHTSSSIEYTNDNSEVAIYLLRMAEVDTEYAYKYRNTALQITDWLISIQYEDGSWRRSSETFNRTACFTAHAVSALSMAYKYTNNRSTYKTAIQNGLNFIGSKILDGGMITLMGNNEAQRPPSSDQSICVRGIAHAELYVDDLDNRETWTANRHTLLAWLKQLVTDEGFVMNGLGLGANGADTINVTDYVYSVPFAIEAFYYSYCVDHDFNMLDMALKIIRSTQSNIYYSQKDVTGVIRGAFNITDKNWDTRQAFLDDGQQGGGGMVYTGWTNAPIASILFTFAEAIENKTILSVCTDAMIEHFVNRSDGQLKIYMGDEVLHFPIVEDTSISASPVKLYANHKKCTLSYLM